VLRYPQPYKQTKRSKLNITPNATLYGEIKTALEVLYICTIDATKLTTDRHEASRGLFATADLLVFTAGRGNNFVGGTCAPPSALLVCFVTDVTSVSTFSSLPCGAGSN